MCTILRLVLFPSSDNSAAITEVWIIQIYGTVFPIPSTRQGFGEGEYSGIMHNTWCSMFILLSINILRWRGMVLSHPTSSVFLSTFKGMREQMSCSWEQTLSHRRDHSHNLSKSTYIHYHQMIRLASGPLGHLLQQRIQADTKLWSRF